MINRATEKAARRVHEAAIVFDAHTDSLQRMLMNGDDIAVRSDGDPLVERCDLPRYREGGVKAQVFGVWVETLFVPRHAVRRTLQLIDVFQRFLDDNIGRVKLARSGADVKRIINTGQFAALLSIEGGDAIANDLGVLRVYNRLGASSMTLCHSRTTDWVDSSTDEARWNGLSEFGQRVVREMNRIGMAVDVSHTSDAAVRDAIEASSAPVIASHSNCRAVCDHRRNLSDDLLRAIGASGGVVGINFYSGFLDQDFVNRFNETQPDIFKELNTRRVPDAELEEFAKARFYEMLIESLPRPPFSIILDHIEHAVEIAGIDHVGLGGDLDLPHLSTPVGFDDVTSYPMITEGLLARGFSASETRKVLGENFLRVLDEVAAVSKEKVRRSDEVV